MHVFILPQAFSLIDDAGNGFRLDGDVEGMVRARFYERGVLVFDRTSDAQPHESFQLFDFALSVGRAIRDDEDEGWIRECFVDDSLILPGLQIDLEFDLPDPDSNEEIEATLTCWEGDLFNVVAESRITVSLNFLWERAQQITNVWETDSYKRSEGRLHVYKDVRAAT